MKSCDFTLARPQVFIVIFSSLLIFSMISACQDELYGLDDELTSLSELKVHLSAEEVSRLPREVQSRLRVGLVWLGVNIPSSWCAEQLSTQLLSSLGSDPRDRSMPSEEDSGAEEVSDGPSQEAMIDIAALSQLLKLCRDPLGVAPVLAGPSVAIEPQSGEEFIKTTLAFTSLPPSEVLIGTPDARVGYASLVVFEDQNENGVLDLGRSFPPIFWQNDRPNEDEEGGEGRRGPRGLGEEKTPDLLYSASFSSLLSHHQRLVFREGEFIESYFYPLGGCIPKRGFSVIEVEGDFQAATCISHPMTEPILLRITEPNSRQQEVVCEPSDVWIFEPPETPINERFEQSCVSPTELAVTDPEQSCKHLTILSLVDCSPTELDCQQPEWDLRDMPPSWWPCGEDESK